MATLFSPCWEALRGSMYPLADIHTLVPDYPADRQSLDLLQGFLQT